MAHGTSGNGQWSMERGLLQQIAQTGNKRFSDVPVRPTFVSTERHTKASDRKYDGKYGGEQRTRNYKEPKNFRTTWNHPDECQREKWQEAIRTEFHDMTRRGIWRKMKRRDLPTGKMHQCKWVLKTKRNEMFQARLLACGYSQIPGVDFT
jgi:hypothetical protein